ncbi:MoaD/ThiS family protein [Marinomonas epiphytica]
MTKVNVVFFASLRESLGLDSAQIDVELPMSMMDFKQVVAAQLTNGDVLLQAGVQSSINFEFSRDQDEIPLNVQEVALFPPVTGG